MCSDACTTVYEYFFHGTVHLKMVKMINFIFNLLILERERKGEGGKEKDKETLILFPLIYEFIG